MSAAFLPAPGRGAPRWSEAGKLVGILLYAGLLEEVNAIVIVGPPLAASEPIRGSVPAWLVPLKVMLASELMLYPASVMVPKPLPPDKLVDSIEPLRMNVAPALARSP